MESRFGWTLLSRDALRRAETQVRDDIEGVRDEIGFLALHQAYADRFFPGTSVLHTRLRYVLFVPWMYQRIVLNRSGERVSELLQKEELELTRRLRHLGAKHGVIGIRSYPKPTAQPPSMIYWTALAKWRILKPLASGALPPRQAVHRAIAKKGPRHRLLDDDQQLLIEDEPFFGTLPPPPREWQSANEKIDFRLQPTEAQFLRGCFLTVTRSEGVAAPSLLARLVDNQVPLADRDSLWSPKVKWNKVSRSRIRLKPGRPARLRKFPSASRGRAGCFLDNHRRRAARPCCIMV